MASSSKIKVRLERGAPDDFFVQKLARVDHEQAENENKLAKDDLFRREIEQNLASGGRSGYVQICAPFELHSLARFKKPKHIVEVGVSAGVSSAYFLRAILLNGSGTLHSIDLPEFENGAPNKRSSWALPKGKAPGWAIPAYLKKNWDLRLGKSGEMLPRLIKNIDSVDMFLYDVPYEIDEAIGDFAIVNQKLKKGSIVLADNAQVPITWWAKKRKSGIYRRKNSGLRGFRID